MEAVLTLKVEYFIGQLVIKIGRIQKSDAINDVRDPSCPERLTVACNHNATQEDAVSNFRALLLKVGVFFSPGLQLTRWAIDARQRS